MEPGYQAPGAECSDGETGPKDGTQICPSLAHVSTSGKEANTEKVISVMPRA
jgi:hypothetical protein